MNIALIGYGKVGKFINELAINYPEINITKIFDPIAFGNRLKAEELKDIDVCIDFSIPSSVLKNAKIVTLAKKKLSYWNNRLGKRFCCHKKFSRCQ